MSKKSKETGKRGMKGIIIGAVAAVVIIVVLVQAMNVQIPYINDNEQTNTVYSAPNGVTFTDYADYIAYMNANYPGQVIEDPPTTITRDAALLEFSVYDILSGGAVTTSTTSFDVCQANAAGEFNLKAQADTVTVASTPDYNPATKFAQGTEIIMHVDCTGNPSGGLDYYDNMYYTKLIEGYPIYRLTYEMFTGSPGAYKINIPANAETTGFTITYGVTSDTYYWNVGKLFIHPRASAANFDTKFSYQSTKLAEVTDGSTWIDTDAEITANATLSSTTTTAYFEVIMGAANIGYGSEVLTVDKDGEIGRLHAFLIMSTTMQNINFDPLDSNDWIAISDSSLYNEKAFAYDITANMGEQYGQKGVKDEWSIPIPIWSQADNTEYLFKLWCIDMQKPESVAAGYTTTTVPTAYGFLTAYGPGAMLQASAYTTSSGAGSGRILQSYLTSPSS